jgi:hypothetical protein
VTDNFDQLAAELQWLRARASQSTQRKSQNVEVERIETRIENYLLDPRLRELINILEDANRDHLGRPGGRPFLLGPYLHYIVQAVESRRHAIAKMPALGRTPAELREHYREAAEQAAALAAALRKAPQPNVVPMPSGAGEAFGLFWPPSEFIFEDATPVSELLDRVATTLRSITRSIPARVPRRLRGKNQHNRQQASEIRRFVAGVFAGRFRRVLGRPFHDHVATLATVLSDINTDADYVKKEEKRGRGKRGQNPPKN